MDPSGTPCLQTANLSPVQHHQAERLQKDIQDETVCNMCCAIYTVTHMNITNIYSYNRCILLLRQRKGKQYRHSTKSLRLNMPSCARNEFIIPLSTTMRTANFTRCSDALSECRETDTCITVYKNHDPYRMLIVTGPDAQISKFIPFSQKSHACCDHKHEVSV